MLKGVNDSLSDAKELVRLLKGIPAKINLIPFNPWPGSAYECSDWETIETFAGFSSTPMATPRRSARRAAATSWRPAASLKERIRAHAQDDRLALEAMMIAGHGAD